MFKVIIDLTRKSLLPFTFIICVVTCILHFIHLFATTVFIAICRNCNDDKYFALSVGLAKLLFPMEAKVAMDIAQVEGTSEFPSAGMISKVMSDAQRTTVDLNDAPFKLKEEHLNRLRALSKTGNNHF